MKYLDKRCEAEMLGEATMYYVLITSITREFIHIQYSSDTAKPQCAIILQVHPIIGDKTYLPRIK